MFGHGDTGYGTRNKRHNRVSVSTSIDIIYVVGGSGSNKRVVAKHNGDSRATHFTWVNSYTIGYNRSGGSKRDYRHVNKFGNNDRLVRSAGSGSSEFIHNTQIGTTNWYFVDEAIGAGNTQNCGKLMEAVVQKVNPK